MLDHPETLPDEIFVANVHVGKIKNYSNFYQLGWETKRLGNTAYNTNGCVLRHSYPVFVKKSELEEDGVSYVNGKLSVEFDIVRIPWKVTGEVILQYAVTQGCHLGMEWVVLLMNNQHLIPPEAVPKVYFPGAAVKALMPLGECKRIICLEWAAKWQVKDSYLWHWRTFYAGVMFKVKK